MIIVPGPLLGLLLAYGANLERDGPVEKRVANHRQSRDKRD